MTTVTIYRAENLGQPLAIERVTQDVAEIQRLMGDIGITFERWNADKVLAPGATQEDILAAYRSDIDRLMTSGGYQSADVVRMHPDHPEREAFRGKFIEEHIHEDDEVRFFVEGSGAFYIRDGDKDRAFRVVTSPGDLMLVPKMTRHWFDMGPRPHFAAIRLFVTPAGWVAKFTGDDIARRTPLFEAA